MCIKLLLHRLKIQKTGSPMVVTLDQQHRTDSHILDLIYLTVHRFFFITMQSCWVYTEYTVNVLIECLIPYRQPHTRLDTFDGSSVTAVG